MASTYTPVIIIGTGRSGTNMLRNVLTSLPGFGTWPCDEINYIWRYDNRSYPTDELPADRATPRARRYIRRAFDRRARHDRLTHVVEKTCANTLRVPFVDRILNADARYVEIIRDGRDVVASARKRWTAELDLPYILRKARFVPPTDIPYYGLRYAFNRVYRLLSPEKQLKSWGPRFRSLPDALARHGLTGACAVQWQTCLEISHGDLAALDSTRVHSVRYEELTAEPAQGLRGICDFLGVDLGPGILSRAVARVKASSVGKWRQDLSADDVSLVTELAGSTLQQFGYE